MKKFALEEGELMNEEKKCRLKYNEMSDVNKTIKGNSKSMEKQSSLNKMNITELNIQINKLKIDIGSVKNSIDMKNKEVDNTIQLLKNIQNSVIL